MIYLESKYNCNEFLSAYTQQTQTDGDKDITQGLQLEPDDRRSGPEGPQ